MTAPDAIHWRQRSACKDEDPDIFFRDSARGIKKAKAICATCPVTGKCLEDALASEQRFGTWAGLSERELARLRRAA